MISTAISSVIIGFILATNTASAHMKLSQPKPLGADTDPYLEFPLDMFGPKKPFPCAGHLKSLETASASAVWEAGSNQSFYLAGDAPHYGGSCQASLSFDKGKTWRVVQSFPGNCPHRSAQDKQEFGFNIPAEAKASKEVIFAWTWFNREREMYMNCAKVEIVRKSHKSAGNALETYPKMFVANVVQTPGCRTPGDHSELEFPDMGSDPRRIQKGDSQYPLAKPEGCRN